MSNQSSTSNDKPRTVEDIISVIEKKSKGGGYIYRGERELHKNPPHNGKVSSNLWREYGIEVEHFDIELVQKELLAAAKRHIGDLPQNFRVDVIALLNAGGELTEETEEAIDFEILTDIQHYGGKTNLIDFTTDYFIALFFACDGEPDENGRIILQKTDELRDRIKHPRNPRHRVIAQKSVFIRPRRGFIEPDENDIVIIPANLKQRILEHLRNYHGISTEVIYNDLYGFIRNQDIHGEAYTRFYRGFACQNRVNEALTHEEKQRQYEEAIKHYKEAIDLKPDLADAYYYRGIAYAEIGDLDSAISDYNTARKLNPYDADGYYNRGNVSADKREFDNAIKDYTEAIQRRPDFAEAYYNRGNAYESIRKFDNAINDYTEVIRINPNYAMAYKNRSMLYAVKGESDNAINDYTEAIRINPNDTDTYYTRGMFYTLKGEFDNAINDYTEIIRINPNYIIAYTGRGVAYLKKGEFDDAIRDYTEVIKRKPDYAQAYYSRGVARLRLREWEEAKSDMTTAKNMGEDISAAFRNNYTSVEDFEQETGIQLPADIAALLTPSQA